MLMALLSLGGAATTGLFGKDPKQGSTFNKGQMGNLGDIYQTIKGMTRQGAGDITQNQGYQQGQEWLNSLFNDPEFFKNMEAPAMRQFEEEIVPGLANRFASMGSGGALNSTAFRNQLAREGSNLATNLAANRSMMQQQGVNQQLGYAQQPTSNYLDLIRQALGQGTQNTYTTASNPFAQIFGAFAGGMGAGQGQPWGASMAGQHPSTFQNPTKPLGGIAY